MLRRKFKGPRASAASQVVSLKAGEGAQEASAPEPAPKEAVVEVNVSDSDPVRAPSPQPQALSPQKPLPSILVDKSKKKVFDGIRSPVRFVDPAENDSEFSYINLSHLPLYDFYSVLFETYSCSIFIYQPSAFIVVYFSYINFPQFIVQLLAYDIPIAYQGKSDIEDFGHPRSRTRTNSHSSVVSIASISSGNSYDSPPKKRKKRVFNEDEAYDPTKFTMADLIDYKPKGENNLRAKWKDLEKKFKEEGFQTIKVEKTEPTEQEIAPRVSCLRLVP